MFPVLRFSFDSKDVSCVRMNEGTGRVENVFAQGNKTDATI
ncbi:hypothetical protein RSSM_00316 [Rhodopirellula sallentina SM41]|uniref:Uncharacterized protein n=1 Tax=Rhodopirellula sallentina SM41 TaxID=1263870 RepID=M5UK76_9BACT|nr:hypothetical protein RSSM_00316 [Rhodopirellula sallentina SM41]